MIDFIFNFQYFTSAMKMKHSKASRKTRINDIEMNFPYLSILTRVAYSNLFSKFSFHRFILIILHIINAIKSEANNKNIASIIKEVFKNKIYIYPYSYII